MSTESSLQDILEKSFVGLTLQRFLQYLASSLGVLYMLYEVSQYREDLLNNDVILVSLANSIFYPFSKYAYDFLFKKITGKEKIFTGWAAYIPLFWMVNFVIIIMVWFFSVFVGPVSLFIMCLIYIKNKSKKSSESLGGEV